MAKITLNNPPLNMVTLPLAGELFAALRQMDSDDEVRCAVLTGSGSKAFCVGSDVKEFPRRVGRRDQQKAQKRNEAFNMLEMLSKPVIAAIEGVICGGGMEMAMACDIRVMSSDSKAAFPEVNLGVFPGSGGSFRLPKLVGRQRRWR